MTNLIVPITTYTPSISEIAASAASNSSTDYTWGTRGYAPGYDLNWTGVGLNGNVNTATCTYAYYNYSVAYTMQNKSTSDTGQLSIFVSQNTGAVLGNLTMWGVDGNHASSGKWTGYTTSSFGRYTPTGEDDAWNGLGVSANSGHCGSLGIIIGICGISVWGGLSQAAGGGSTIVQSGMDAYATCQYLLFVGWSCPTTYTPWWETYPNQAIYCTFQSLNKVNQFVSEVYYVQGTGNYWIVMADLTSGNFCAGYYHGPALSLPWAQYQVEAIPNGIGGVLQTPNFNFQNEFVWASGYPNNLVPWVAGQQTVANTALGSMYYSTPNCHMGPFSCFSVT
ncbi:MAG: hypothetical protein L3K11_00270 [Thermoplasmata archaeon]|nr:hypothetical protein [Thermoplasmata archaeon]